MSRFVILILKILRREFSLTICSQTYFKIIAELDLETRGGVVV